MHSVSLIPEVSEMLINADTSSPVHGTWRKTEICWFYLLVVGESYRKRKHLTRSNRRVAKMFHQCCFIVADLSQEIGFLFCLCFVSLVWTQPKSALSSIFVNRTGFQELN
jgi:hypothetical protein